MSRATAEAAAVGEAAAVAEAITDAGAETTAGNSAGPSGADAVLDYAWSVIRRARKPMPPFNYQVNWADQPSRFKTYPGAERIALPGRLPRLPTLAQLRDGAATPLPDAGELERLGLLLRLGYGVLQRRLAVNWNQDLSNRARFPHATWGRGTASGGGMYPVELYWVAGPSAPVPAGIYHYATGHHALERLLAGDVSPAVAAATGDHSTDQFLLLGINFWKNSFKYNSFCYHVVTQDLGALLGTLDLIAPALTGPIRRLLCFDDRALDGLLGFDAESESVFAAVALPGAAIAPGVRETASGGARVAYPAFQRSRTVRTFSQITEVHRAGLDPEWPRPPVAAVDRAAIGGPLGEAGAPGVVAPAVALPAPPDGPRQRPVSELITSRHSSFGAFRREPPIQAADLGGVLAQAAAARRYRADIKHPDGTPELTRLWVFTHRVTGVDIGPYEYHPDRHELRPTGRSVTPDMPGFLQRSYFLTNYSMDQVGAVLAISGRLGAMVDAFGPRGYRMLNTEVGSVAQAVYLGASAHGIGCGAVLGFDNVAMNEALGLDGDDESTLLFLLLGSEQPVAANVAYQLW
jgi:SagB-type dehydrogenase family enzyme